MDMLLGFELFLFFIVAGLFLIWIWAMVDIITSKFKEDLMQIIWLLVVFFLPFIGVLLYLLIGRSMKQIPLDEDIHGKKYDHLMKLKALLDDGALTPEEYEIEKQKILS
ncbi:MAG: SHOCT domain-containing protein [Campylobacterales bacterium]|nr:SHOCT domain-containing protein [Campylobacterales bacterium]